MKKIVKNNLLLFMVFALFFSVLVFCHFQTMILNDDLPYSLYFRAGERITSIRQIIINQIFDYSHISPRIFIHVIVQFLLMFEKNLWSILNPVIIVTIVFLMAYIIYDITGKKTKLIYIVFPFISAFLLLYNYKYLVYWVAGSVNYVWIFLVLLLFFLYYLKIDFIKKPFLTFFLCLFISMLCEASAIFVIVLLSVDFIIKIILKQVDKRVIIRYFVFLLAGIIGFLFLMLSPSNLGRINLGDDAWVNLNIIEKLFVSIPAISLKSFNGFSFYNLFPIFWIISIGFYLKNNKIVVCYFLFAFMVLLMMLGFIFNSGWLFFLVGIFLLILQVLILISNKDYKLIGVLVGGYAVLYALAITPEYAFSRTGFHTMLIISMFTVYNFIYFNDVGLFLKILFGIIMISLIIFEIVIYVNIGAVKKNREESMRKVLSGKTKVLNVKMIKSPYDKFHIDANSPTDKYYWAYAAFEDYYKLPKDITFKVIK